MHQTLQVQKVKYRYLNKQQLYLCQDQQPQTQTLPHPYTFLQDPLGRHIPKDWHAIGILQKEIFCLFMYYPYNWQQSWQYRKLSGNFIISQIWTSWCNCVDFFKQNFWLFQDKLLITPVNFIRSENNLALLHLFIDARNLWVHALNSEHAQSALCLFVDANWLELVGYAYYCVCVHTLGDWLF